MAELLLRNSYFSYLISLGVILLTFSTLTSATGESSSATVNNLVNLKSRGRNVQVLPLMNPIGSILPSNYFAGLTSQIMNATSLPLPEFFNLSTNPLSVSTSMAAFEDIMNLQRLGETLARFPQNTIPQSSGGSFLPTGDFANIPTFEDIASMLSTPDGTRVVEEMLQRVLQVLGPRSIAELRIVPGYYAAPNNVPSPRAPPPSNVNKYLGQIFSSISQLPRPDLFTQVNLPFMNTNGTGQSPLSSVNISPLLSAALSTSIAKALVETLASFENLFTDPSLSTTPLQSLLSNGLNTQRDVTGTLIQSEVAPAN